MNDLERAVQAVLDGQREAYVHLLNSYLALLTEAAALRQEVARLRAEDGALDARREDA